MTLPPTPAADALARESLRVDGRFAVWLLVLLAIAAYFRVVAVEGTVVEKPLIADARDYYVSAYNLVHRGTYSRSPASIADPAAPVVADAYRSPGEPLIIAPFMGAWPDHARIVERVQWLNVVLGLAAVAAIFFAANAVLPRAAAVAVGLLTACSPHIVSITVYVLSETPATVLIAVLLAVSALGVPQTPRARIAFFVAQGAIVGGLALFRPVFIAFAPLLALAQATRANRRDALVCALIGAFAVVAPWLIRNLVSVPPGDAPSLLATGLLEASYRGYVYAGDPSSFPYGAHADPRFQVLRTSVARTIAEIATKIAADPGSYLWWYLVRKAVYLFQWSNIDGEGDVFVYAVAATPFATNPAFIAVRVAFYMTHALLLLLAAAGAVLAWRSRFTAGSPEAMRPVLRIASLLLAFTYVAHIPFATSTRYLVPVMPALHLLAVFAVVAVYRAAQKRVA